MDASAPATSRQERKFRRSPRRDAIEVALAYGLILAVEWTPRPLQGVLWVVAALGLTLIVWRSFDGWQAMGFRTANFWRSLWIAGAALVLAAVAIAIAARRHTLLVPEGAVGFVAGYLAYAIWTGVQQFLLQGVFLLRFLRLIAAKQFRGRQFRIRQFTEGRG